MKRPLTIGIWATIFSGWLAYFSVGMKVAEGVSARFGPALLRFGQGKFFDAGVFVHARIGELLLLITAAASFFAFYSWLDAWIRRRSKARGFRWVWCAAIGFSLVNCWVGIAGTTALFWGAIGAAAGLQNLMQFHFKRIVFAENPAAQRAVLVGNSQTRAQIDEGLLNERMGTNLWTTEMHYPSAKAFDLLLIERQLRPSKPDVIICYLSEICFYNGSSGEVVPNFLGFQDLSSLRRLDGYQYLEGGRIFYGLLGEVLPLFRYREPVAQVLLGASAVQVMQNRYDTALTVDLEARAREIAATFQVSGESDFQKRGFEEFVMRCRKNGSRLILLVGQCNPVLAKSIAPAVRQDMRAFLQALQSRYPDLEIVAENKLPSQTSDDYEDLTHVKAEAQKRFSIWLADYLAGRARTPDGR